MNYLRSGLTFILLAMVLFLGQPGRSVSAHPPDLYQQTELLTFGQDSISLVWSIQPSAALVPGVWQDTDVNGDGEISETEASTWANIRLAEMALSVDGAAPFIWEGKSVRWPASKASFADGTEAIVIRLSAPLSAAAGARLQLQLHNHFAENLSQHRFIVRGEQAVAFAKPTAALGRLELTVLHLDNNGRIPQAITGTWHTTWDSTKATQLLADSEPVDSSIGLGLGMVGLLLALGMWHRGFRSWRDRLSRQAFARFVGDRNRVCWGALVGFS